MPTRTYRDFENYFTAPFFSRNGQSNLSSEARSLFYEKIAEAVRAGQKIKIFLDFFSLFFVDIAACYETNKKNALYFQWIEHIINSSLVDELAFLFQRFGEENFVIEILFDLSPNAKLYLCDEFWCDLRDIENFLTSLHKDESNNDSPKDFLLSLFLKKLKEKYPALLLTPKNILNHFFHPDMICTVVTATNAKNDRIFGYFPPCLWYDNQCDQTDHWLRMQRIVSAGIPNYTTHASYDVRLKSAADYFKYRIQEDMLTGNHFFNIYFNDNTIPVTREQKRTLPAYVIGVGNQKIPQPTSFIPPSGVVDRLFEYRDRQSRKVNYWCGNRFFPMAPRSLSVFRAPRIDPLADLLEAFKLMEQRMPCHAIPGGGFTSRDPLLFSSELVPQNRISQPLHSLPNTPSSSPSGSGNLTAVGPKLPASSSSGNLALPKRLKTISWVDENVADPEDQDKEIEKALRRIEERRKQFLAGTPRPRMRFVAALRELSSKTPELITPSPNEAPNRPDPIQFFVRAPRPPAIEQTALNASRRPSSAKERLHFRSQVPRVNQLNANPQNHQPGYTPSQTPDQPDVSRRFDY